MLFVLSGPWGVGKGESIHSLKEKYAFKAIIPWTTKELRKEEEGVTYNRIEWNGPAELEEFNAAFEGFWAQPFLGQNNKNFYGYKRSDIERVANSTTPVVMEADTGIVEQLKQCIHSQTSITGKMYFVFLDYRNDHVFQKKIQELECNVRNQKKEHARKERRYYQENAPFFDKRIEGDSHQEIFELLVKYVLEIVTDSPYMLHNRPGPLSDYDIDLAIAQNSIRINIEDSRFSEIYGESTGDISKDCTVDLHLSPRCKVVHPGTTDYFDLISGSSDDIYQKLTQICDGKPQEDDFNEIRDTLSNERAASLNRIFHEKTIDFKKGLLIPPRGIVLCSSVEKLSLNNNVMAFITSKCSYSQLGLSISISQNILQPGHRGVVLFQIVNNLPFAVNIYPYIKIAQVVFFRTISQIKHADAPSLHTSIDNVQTSRYYNDKNFMQVSDYIIKVKSTDSYRQEKRKEKTRIKKSDSWKTAVLIGGGLTGLGGLIISLLTFFLK